MFINKINDTIYKTLKNEIMLLDLKPGSAISEAEISQRFGVSRTPIRQVFLKLSEEGLIDIIPQKGTFISLIDMKYIKDIVYMRLVLETELLREVMDIITEADVNYLKYNLSKQKSLIDFSNNNKEMILEFNKLDNDYHGKLFEIANRPNIWDIYTKFAPHYMRFRILDIFDKTIMEELYLEHQKLLEIIVNKDINALRPHLDLHFKGGFKRLRDVQNQYIEYFKNS